MREWRARNGDAHPDMGDLGELKFFLENGRRLGDEPAPEVPAASHPAGEDMDEGVFDPPEGALNRGGPATALNFKSAAKFASEYVPLAYVVEPIIRSGSLYTLSAKTGGGKTALNIVTALAVATGRGDILAREVHQGRVAYLACENPDDIRMRLKIAAFMLNVDMDALGDAFLILDVRASPEGVHGALVQLAQKEPFALIIVDTLAAFFDGDNINDAVQGGQFMRRLRPLTRISGLPAVLVAAHPAKNASEDNLVPYGSGAILNEVDGNLTLWKGDGGRISLHWQGKLRGIEFEPLSFRFEVTGSPDILDAKGREVHLPTLRPAEDAGDIGGEIDADKALLQAMIADPAASIRDLAMTTRTTKSSIDRRLKRLAKEKLAELVLGKWKVTASAVSSQSGS